MANLRPHRHFNFVGLWKYGFILSAVLIVLAIAGLVTSAVTTGSPLTLGTEFSGGTSIQITEAGDLTEQQVTESFNKAASEAGVDSQISSIQTSSSASAGNGFIIKTTDTNSSDSNKIMEAVEKDLNISASNVQIETIGASWGASVIWRSFLAFLISCVAILIVIAARYRDPRMGVAALCSLFHDLIIIIGIYAWAGMFLHMEVTSDVIAALLAIIGYSLYDTIVSFHRINQNASPQMRMSLKTCANMSVNQIFMRSMNTSVTSVIPVLFMLVLGTDTLRDFAFAMFCGMVIGVYSTFAISTPIYTLWKCRDPQYKRLEDKFPYEVVQSPFTKEMMIEARKASKAAEKAAKSAAKTAGMGAAKAAAPAAAAASAAAAAADKPAPKAEDVEVETLTVDADGQIEEAGEVEEIELELTEEQLKAIGIDELPADGELELTAEQLAALGIEVSDDDDDEEELEITAEMLEKLGITDVADGAEIELTAEQLEQLGFEVEYEDDEEEKSE